MRHLFSILLLVFSSAVQCEDVLPQREAVPRLAVFPLFSEKDPDYGVFMADRLVDELMRHR
ncbi:MAG: hypothetical protein OXU23_17730, partial [Candidatus Poribacteria bacterium]|nr:hypothetical protein [Candidatus Poribacteria bacterium]